MACVAAAVFQKAGKECGLSGSGITATEVCNQVLVASGDGVIKRIAKARKALNISVRPWGEEAVHTNKLSIHELLFGVSLLYTEKLQ